MDRRRGLAGGDGPGMSAAGDDENAQWWLCPRQHSNGIYAGTVRVFRVRGVRLRPRPTTEKNHRFINVFISLFMHTRTSPYFLYLFIMYIYLLIYTF